MRILFYLFILFVFINCSFVEGLIYKRKEQYLPPLPSAYQEVDASDVTSYVTELKDTVKTQVEDILQEAGLGSAVVEAITEELDVGDGLDVHAWEYEEESGKDDNKKERNHKIGFASYCSLSLLPVPLRVVNSALDKYATIDHFISRDNLDISYNHVHNVFQGSYEKYAGVMSVTVIKKRTCIFAVGFLFADEEGYEEQKFAINRFINNLDL